MTCKETHASCLRFDEALNCLVFDNNLGESKPVKIPAPQLSGLLNSSCELVLFANNLALDPIDLTPLLAKVQGSVADLDFRPGPCTLVWTPPDGSAAQTFDLSAILDKAQDGLTYNQTTCVLSYTNVLGELETFSLASVLSKAQDDMSFNPTDCVITYTDVLGNPSEVQLTALFNKMTFDATTCVLTVPVPAGVRNFDLSQVLAKISVAYDPATHSLVVNNNGNVTSQVINCSSLELIATGETCVLRFTNAKGQVNDMPLPGSSFTRDVDACTITVGNGKGGGFTFREGIDPAADITFGLTANKDLKLQVKDECMEIVLPDFVTDVAISDDNCELKIFKWCSDPQTIDIFAALGLTKNAAGGFDIQVKDQICSFLPATLQVNPDNPNEFIFNNQFGQTTVISVPTVALDMDGATLNGSVLQLSFGGDGNPGALNVDICAVVAQNCNATLVVNPDGSLTHTDNAGNITEVPAPTPFEHTPSSIDEGAGTNSFTHNDGDGNPVSIFTGSVADQGDGTVELVDKAGNACRASTETTELLCDTPRAGIHRFRRTSLKDGTEIDQDFGVSSRCAFATGAADGLGSRRVEAADILDIKSNEITIDLPCAGNVMVSAYYDIILDNPDLLIAATAVDLYTSLCIDGQSGVSAGASRWFTLSDAVSNQINSSGDLIRRDGENNVAGYACANLSAGVHTLAMEIHKWRANPGTWAYIFSNIKISTSWSELVCK